MKSCVMKSIDKFMSAGIKDGVFPGGVLLVLKKNRTLFHRAYGTIDVLTRAPVTLDTCFDLASLTKPLATTLAVAKLVQSGALFPEQSLGTLVDCQGDEDKKKISIDHLLRHTAGFPAHRPFYGELIKISCGMRRDNLRHLVMAEPLVSPPGDCQVYSDLGYMVLAWIVEKTVGMPLDRFVDQYFFSPLNLDLFFRPLGEKDVKQVQRRYAATENCPWRGRTLFGEVHDDNAWSVGGVEGHAGLFGTAHAVGKLLCHLLEALHGHLNGNIPGKVLQRFIQRETGRERVADLTLLLWWAPPPADIFPPMHLGIWDSQAPLFGWNLSHPLWWCFLQIGFIPAGII